MSLDCSRARGLQITTMRGVQRILTRRSLSRCRLDRRGRIQPARHQRNAIFRESLLVIECCPDRNPSAALFSSLHECTRNRRKRGGALDGVDGGSVVDRPPRRAMYLDEGDRAISQDPEIHDDARTLAQGRIELFHAGISPVPNDELSHALKIVAVHRVLRVEGDGLPQDPASRRRSDLISPHGPPYFRR